ncbi:MAG TPA: hypothetical protein VK116_19310, partial [Planctomycetota bacterium]|nr:hypothetical protein [Planctomycetota bacterium]
FDPGALTVPAGIDARRFWREFSSRLPTSVFPLLPSWGSRVWWHDSHLHDFKSMGTISIYLGGYTILAASVLAFGLRKRERRRLVLPVLGAIALLAVVFVPILDAVLHRNPSYAESAEVTLVRAGAASTTTIGRLGIRSSGRQAHALRVDGQDARVWPLSLSRDYYSDGRAVGHLLPLVPPESTFADHALYRQRVPPWGRQDLLILRERAPVTELSGQATLIAPRSTSPTAKLFVRATLPDGVGSELAQLITVGLGDAESMLSSDGDRNNADDSRARLFWQTRLRPQNGREIHFEATVVRVVPRGGDNKNRIAVEVGTLLGNEVVFDWPTSRLPAVFVVCESPSDSDAFPPLVSSDDLRFVRRFSHPEHPLAEKSVDFRRHYLIFELPITEMAGR